jgi:hypothetical protein
VASAILMELNIRLTVLVVETARLERRGVNDTCVGSWPYPQTLDLNGKACQGLTLELFTNIQKLRPKRVGKHRTQPEKTLDRGKPFNISCLSASDEQKSFNANDVNSPPVFADTNVTLTVRLAGGSFGLQTVEIGDF